MQWSGPANCQRDHNDGVADRDRLNFARMVLIYFFLRLWCPLEHPIQNFETVVYHLLPDPWIRESISHNLWLLTPCLVINSHKSCLLDQIHCYIIPASNEEKLIGCTQNQNRVAKASNIIPIRADHSPTLPV